MHSTQDNLIRSGEPSRSALHVATLRAAHQLLDEPIVFDDPLALPILGQDAEAQLRDDPFRFNDPVSRGVRAALIVRSKFAEDELQRAVQAGVRQYVILGAGLDTFAFRHPHAANGVHVFEVDHSSTQRLKRAMLESASIAPPPSMTFVGVDFEHDHLAERLQNAGFRCDQPAFFSWLGVTVYLMPEAVMNTLGFVSTLPPESAIVFDYRVTPALLESITRMVSERLAEHFAEQREPWKSAFDPLLLKTALGEMGFNRVQDLGPDDLNARYLARRKDGLQMRGGFRLICARM